MNRLGHDITLTSSERGVIEDLSAGVKADVRHAFETTFKAWKDKWFTGSARFSNDTHSNKSFPEYEKLRRMGNSILPLVVAKLSEPENFVSLVLYDDIADKNICVDATDPEFALEGEQIRAIRTIKKYIRTQYQLGDSQMPTYNLKTTFTQVDLERFYATGTNVVIAKPTEGTQPNVAWVVYRPLRLNTINWEEQYGIYASNSEMQNGANLIQLTPNEPYPAVFEKLYTLNSAGNMIGPKEGGTKNAYTVVNEYDNRSGPAGPGKGYMIMGLFQNANVDGQSVEGNAVSAAPVLYKSTAVMTPFTTVYLWTQSQIKGNTVVTNVTSAMTKVVFGGRVSSVDLQYDSDTGTFIPIANSVSLVEEGALEISAIYPLL
jgi:hypothetical protein